MRRPEFQIYKVIQVCANSCIAFKDLQVSPQMLIGLASKTGVLEILAQSQYR